MKDGKNRNHLTEIEQEAEPALADGQIYQLLVIGGGPAGMAAALAAKKAGLEKIAILDRNQRWGGILPQCIHDGFGIYTYGETLTGPEYASRWYQNLQKEAIPYYCATTVIEICKKDEFFAVDYLGMVCGRGQIYGESIIFATGCRERTLGQMRIPGSRPAGIYTAGEAQYMINMQNYLPGRSIVILGSGDIGLIMARRCIMEGMKVKLILGE
ncbi:MAG: FAD-dependent oxidoreductase, partial [Clostridiales bacterium]